MIASLRLTCGSLLLLAGFAVAQPSEEVLSALLKNLASSDFSAREQASEKLIAIGEPARAFLTEARTTLDLEGRLRIDAILERLSAVAPTETRVVFEATQMDLILDEVPIAKATAQLGDAAGVPLVFGRSGANLPPTPGSDVPVSFKAQGISFFEALDRFCAVTGCVFTADYASGGYVLTPGQAGKIGPVRYDGPMRVLATSLSISRSTRFTDPSTVNANLQFRINVEPRARVIGIVSPLRGATAKDDLGNPLAFREYAGQRNLQAMGRQRQSFQSLSFDAPPPEATKLVGVSIPLELVVPASMLSSELRSLEPAGPEADGAGPLRLKVDSAVDSQPGQRIVTISFRPPVPEGDAELRNVPSHEEIRVYDTKGQEVPLPLNTIGRRRVGARETRTLRLTDVPVGRVVVRCLKKYEVLKRSVTFPELKLP